MPRGSSLDLESIQGNVVPGFNKDHQAFVLVRFGGRDEGQTWLRALQPQLASAAEVEGFRTVFRSIRERRPAAESHGRDGGALRVINSTWANVAISFDGLRHLAEAHTLTRFPPAFRSNRIPGMEGPTDRDAPHAVLILGADYVRNLDDELERQRRQMAACGVDEITTFRGNTLPGDQRGHEHFGFKDGVSQPLISGTAWGTGPPVAPGEFILGELDEAGVPSGPRLPNWTRNGSYLAFLQLRQHVETFWTAMRDHATQFGVQPEDLASWIVGRRPDGDGTALSEVPTRLSHLGRAYSRWLPPSEAQRHRLLRRGIPYDNSATSDATATATADRGLLFLAYQADLERQFEHVWGHWLNAPGFPVPGAGRDALVGQVNWPDQAMSARVRPAAAARPGRPDGIVSLTLPPFVTPLYGGYFFAPSIDGLTQLLGGASAPLNGTR